MSNYVIIGCRKFILKLHVHNEQYLYCLIYGIFSNDYLDVIQNIIVYLGSWKIKLH